MIYSLVLTSFASALTLQLKFFPSLLKTCILTLDFFIFRIAAAGNGTCELSTQRDISRRQDADYDLYQRTSECAQGKPTGYEEGSPVIIFHLTENSPLKFFFLNFPYPVLYNIKFIPFSP